MATNSQLSRTEPWEDVLKTKVWKGSCCLGPALGMEKLFLWFWGLGLWLWCLVQAFSLDLWHLEVLELWPCSLHLQECSWDQEEVGCTRGLDPTWTEAHTWNQGPRMGHMPTWALASETLLSSVAQYMVLGLLTWRQNCARQILTESAATRRWRH